jgi:hypothetical protein
MAVKNEKLWETELSCLIHDYFNVLKPKTYFIYHQRYHIEILSSAHNEFVSVVWISEQTAIISLYSINLLVFITEAESVYCAVRTGPLNKTNTVSSLKV